MQTSRIGSNSSRWCAEATVKYLIMITTTIGGSIGWWFGQRMG
ncbi:MAG: hypothetical protein RLZZ63_831, partial [Gemmatimonadota bacterium]